MGKHLVRIIIVNICSRHLLAAVTGKAREPNEVIARMLTTRPLTICSRVGNSIHLLDPMTLQQTDVASHVYWRQPFESLATVSDLIEFVVLDCEPSGPVRGRYVLADCQITRANTVKNNADEDGMGDDGIYHTRTHLGAILQPGDTVLGYHLTNSNFNNEAFESMDEGRLPDVVLVKKTYPNRRKKSKPRNWKLRSIAKEAEDVEEGGKTLGRGALGRRGGVDQKNVERDYELFLRDLEEDREMRAAVNLYKVDQAKAADGAAEGGEGDVDMGAGGKSGSGMRGGKRRGGARAQAQAAQGGMEVDQDMDMDAEQDGDSQADDEEEDFPEVELDELLEHFEEMDMADELDGGQEV
jgi:nonsense-mediated mRNA decay protein 3